MGLSIAKTRDRYKIKLVKIWNKKMFVPSDENEPDRLEFNYCLYCPPAKLHSKVHRIILNNIQ